jgi:uncharacterized protein (DUF2147 family)
MKFRAAFALSFLLATAGLAHADPEQTAAGFWEADDDDGNPTAWFLFAEKGDVYSARLVKGFKPKGDDKPPQVVCNVCPGKKKGAHIMGLTLFWGMKREGLEYRGGSVLDPRDGSVYHAQMDLSEDGKELAVRGYIGIPMLGKTQTWKRLPEDAMKKEDIPKEILAGGEEASTDKPEKPKHAHKPKGDKVKADKIAPADTPAAEPTPDAKDSKESQ